MDICIGNIRVVSLSVGLEKERILKWRGMVYIYNFQYPFFFFPFLFYFTEECNQG